MRSRVFISGLTGTLGTALARLHRERGDEVWGCARSEVTAVRWLEENPRLATLFLADAAQLGMGTTDLARHLPSMDRLYHCAALKHVDMCEQHPIEAMEQNVYLTGIVARACKLTEVPMVFVSSDKACLPQGVYGATKLMAERIAVREGAAVVRLGNLIGSSGSVFQRWAEAVAKGKTIQVTDRDMTRYFIGVEQAAEFLIEHWMPGKVRVPARMKSVRLGTVADAIGARARDFGDEGQVVEVGVRPGETLYQWLVAPGERVTELDDAWTLGDGAVCDAGKNSLNAERWDVDELLEVAGIR